MTTFYIGDVQGCDDTLGRLLSACAFNPGVDTAVFVGDLVNRGPESLAVMRRVLRMGSSALCVAGNHDLHALAIFHGVRKPGKGDTLADLLAAPDAHQLFGAIAQWPLMLQTPQTFVVHAGVLPNWDATQCIASASIFTETVQQKSIKNTFAALFGNLPSRWQPNLAEPDALRVAVNAFTRLRFCTAQGDMEFASKGDIATAPAGHMPWFEVPGRLLEHQRIVFGHWSTLGLVQRPTALGLDTGCVWGGLLTAAVWPEGAPAQIVQVGGV